MEQTILFSIEYLVGINKYIKGGELAELLERWTINFVLQDGPSISTVSPMNNSCVISDVFRDVKGD